MKFRFALATVLMLIQFKSTTFGQCPSLVPNGGFEENAGIPTDDCSWALANGWTNAATSSDCNSNNGTPDYFHLQGVGSLSSLPVNYFADLLPFEGNAVMGIGGNLSFLPNAREYISIALTSPLVVGNEYTLSFSMNNGIPQVGGMYTDGWGVLLSTGVVLQPVGTNGLIAPTGNLFSVPGVFSSQVWQTYTYTFIADQAYTQLTFGNFLSDANQTRIMYGVQDFVSLSYVFIDNFILEGATVPPPVVDLGPDFELCDGPTALNATTSGALSYLWNTSNPSSTLNVTAPGQYFVDVEWACGVVSDTINVFECPVDPPVDPPVDTTDTTQYFCDIYVPNSFSPNDDGANDYFAPVFECEIASYEFRIFNRWGVEIFSTTDPYEKWTGVAKEKSTYAAQNDAYIWAIKAVVLSPTEGRIEKKRTGQVTLFR